MLVSLVSILSTVFACHKTEYNLINLNNAFQILQYIMKFFETRLNALAIYLWDTSNLIKCYECMNVDIKGTDFHRREASSDSTRG